MPLAAWLGAAVSLSACVTPDDRVTNPATPQASAIEGLWTLSLWLGAGVWMTVMLLLAVPLLRSRRARRRATDAATSPADVPATWGLDRGRHDTADPADGTRSDRDEPVRRRLLWIGGIVGPGAILLVLLVASGRVGATAAHVERDGDLVIEVVGHMFWWEVHYPQLEITTANEIHVPADRPVRLELSSADVIHSFWVPRVHGKIDLIPGRVNRLTFEPEQVGRFRGACAEFCGLAHAQMALFVEVQEPGAFDAWVQDQRRPAPEPATTAAGAGREVFFQAGCASCHAIRGTEARGTVGPDLTHLASRGSLASGIAPNTRDTLQRLIEDPAGLKPGIRMPATQLTAEELDVLLDYVESLR